MRKFSIGVDFGSLSARAVLMDAETGKISASSTFSYPHGIMDSSFIDGTPLPPDWALHCPSDYWDALHYLIPDLLVQSKARPDEIQGIGLDATSCTILPATGDGLPLSELPTFHNTPHAYIKLWKHHAAQPYVSAINDCVQKLGLLSYYGGTVSSEHFLPKAVQIAMEAPDVYQAADRLLEVSDWLVWRLCGREVRNYSSAAYKSFYCPETGDLPKDFLCSIHPALHSLNDKYPANIRQPGDLAGFLTPEAAAWVGLIPGIPVAAGCIDAHVTLLGCRIYTPDQLLMIIGTSTCEILMSHTYRAVPGISGCVRDGILPGMVAYEGGQPCVGDLFAWFTSHCVPPEYWQEAAQKGLSIHDLLSEKAARLHPGESGLIALDWWNGVRSLLLNFDLSGLLVGMTLRTKPEDIYRALIEATAFGARKIMDALTLSGLRINTIAMAGGIPEKNHLLTQLYADICKHDVRLIHTEQSGAAGSAVLGIAAARSGSRSIADILRRFPAPSYTVFHPTPSSAATYDSLYQIYCELYQCFGQKAALMQDLKRIKECGQAASRRKEEGTARAVSQPAEAAQALAAEEQCPSNAIQHRD